MNGALSVDRVPAGRIGGTVKLGIETDLAHRIFDRMADEPPCRLPRRPAGCSSNHPDVNDLAVLDLHLKLRSTEELTIITKTDLSWKSASGRRGKQPFPRYFFPGSNEGDIIFSTECGKVGGEIAMPQKIEDKIAGNFPGKKLAGIIKDRRQWFIDIDYFDLEKIPAKFSHPVDFRLATAILLKDDDMLS